MESPDPDPAPAGAKAARPAFLVVFPSVMVPMFLALVDVTMIAAALPAIAGAFGAVEWMAWIVTAYLIAATVAAPIYGRLGDLLGRRRLLFVALACFVSASLLCAAAPNTLVLIVGRVLQGLGGAGLMVLSQAIIGENVVPRERAAYQGYLSAIGISSSTFGPVLGGFLTEHFGWRAVFLVHVPLGLVAAVLVLRLPSRIPKSGPIRFDILGLAVFAVFVVTALLALQEAQRGLARWGTVLVLLGGAVGALALFLAIERRAPSPLIPLALIRHPAIWRCDGLAACFGALLVSLLTFVPVYLRVVHGVSASETGLLLLPMTVGMGIGSVITGQIISRTGRTTILPSIGLVVVTVVLAAFALASPVIEPWQVSVLLGIGALFMGTVMSVVQVTVQSSAGPAMLGAAAASIQLSRSLGSALGTAATSMVLFLMLSSASPDAAALLGSVLQEGPDVLDGLSAARRVAVQGHFAEGFRAAFLTAAAIASAAVLLACTIPVRRL